MPFIFFSFNYCHADIKKACSKSWSCQKKPIKEKSKYCVLFCCLSPQFFVIISGKLHLPRIGLFSYKFQIYTVLCILHGTCCLSYLHYRHMYNNWRAAGLSWPNWSKSSREPGNRFCFYCFPFLSYFARIIYCLIICIEISWLQGIFISSSGDQTHSMSGNGT